MKRRTKNIIGVTLAVGLVSCGVMVLAGTMSASAGRDHTEKTAESQMLSAVDNFDVVQMAATTTQMTSTERNIANQYGNAKTGDGGFYRDKLCVILIEDHFYICYYQRGEVTLDFRSCLDENKIVYSMYDDGNDGMFSEHYDGWMDMWEALNYFGAGTQNNVLSVDKLKELEGSFNSGDEAAWYKINHSSEEMTQTEEDIYYDYGNAKTGDGGFYRDKLCVILIENHFYICYYQRGEVTLDFRSCLDEDKIVYSMYEDGSEGMFSKNYDGWMDMDEAVDHFGVRQPNNTLYKQGLERLEEDFNYGSEAVIYKLENNPISIYDVYDIDGEIYVKMEERLIRVENLEVYTYKISDRYDEPTVRSNKIYLPEDLRNYIVSQDIFTDKQQERGTISYSALKKLVRNY